MVDGIGVYIGVRHWFSGCHVEYRNDEGTRLVQHVREWSESLEWGYGGQGPSDMALSILVDALGSVQLAYQLAERFKEEVIATLPRNGWVLSEAFVLDWATDVRRRRSMEEVAVGSL